MIAIRPLGYSISALQVKDGRKAMTLSIGDGE